MKKRLHFDHIHDEAQANLAALKGTPYVGRWMVIGLNTAATNMLQVYGISGRSPESRNRVFVEKEHGWIHTEVADPAKPQGNPELTLYPAMAEAEKRFIVTNGRQTSDMAEGLRASAYTPLNKLLCRHTFEDDTNRTARISAIATLDPTVDFSIIKRNPYTNAPDRCLFTPYLAPGYGYFISTYADDKGPEEERLPPFEGEPLVMPLLSTNVVILNTFWDAINPDNQVAVAVKLIDLGTGESETVIRNKYERVKASPEAATVAGAKPHNTPDSD